MQCFLHIPLGEKCRKSYFIAAQVAMISLQNTRDKQAASMLNKPCFLSRSIRIDKTVQILKLA